MSSREGILTSVAREQDWSRKHNNHKFLSIKSVIRNKKIVVKKSMPNYIPSPPLASMEVEQTLSDVESFRKTQTSAPNSTNANVVNIQFSEHYSLPTKTPSVGTGLAQEQKTKKRIMHNLLLD